MTAVTVRLAQLQGLHRDGTLFGLSPFETEMRRRLWWNICTLDRRAAEEQGSTALIWESSFDTKMPLNINDSDIHPDSTSFPEPVVGTSDMSFVLLRVEHWKAYPQFHKPSDSPEQLSQEKAAEYIRDKEKILESIKEHFETTYLRYFDTSVPFFWLLNTFTRQSFVSRSTKHAVTSMYVLANPLLIGKNGFINIPSVPHHSSNSPSTTRD
jgi:hypothetical protein